MKIVLVGTGRMGQAVEALAHERGHDVVARFNTRHPLATAEKAALQDAEAVIDFSLPSLALDHIDLYCQWNLTAVIGTTGWYDGLDRVRAAVAQSEAALLYAPNFSLGVALVARAVQALGPVLDRLPDYDVAVHEAHHTGKVDSPSGTALLLANILLNRLARKTRLETETQHQPIDPDALHVTAGRLGSVFGEHTVYFDSPFDQITLAHRAKNRQGFAYGALRAAEWLPGRKGLFTLDDLLLDF